MSEHKYEIVMSNGDRAECDTVAAVLVAAETMCQDSGGESTVQSVTAGGGFHPAITAVARIHLSEEEA